MQRWERKLAVFSAWKMALDLLRWMIILGVWGLVFWKLLTDVSLVWALIWLPLGFILVMNVVGFSTLPLYVLVARKFGPNIKDIVND